MARVRTAAERLADAQRLVREEEMRLADADRKQYAKLSEQREKVAARVERDKAKLAELDEEMATIEDRTPAVVPSADVPLPTED